MIKKLIYDIKLKRYYTKLGLRREYAAINTVHGIHNFFKKFFSIRKVEISEDSSFCAGSVTIKVNSWLPLSNNAIKKYKQIRPIWPIYKLVNKNLFGTKII